MNKPRRKALQEILNKLENLKIELEQLTSEERDYFDNMPESLQESEKGTRAEEAADNLEEAFDAMETAMDSIESAISQ